MKFLIGITTMLLTSNWAQTQDASPCRLDIKSPKSGDTVETEIQVQGFSSLPPGSYLWILAHRKGISQWWPQGGGAARIQNGDFDVFVTLGNDKDSGRTFEIMGIVLYKAGNSQGEKWVSVSAAKQKGVFGLNGPRPLPGWC